jgi:hypothetical protein
VKLKSLVLGAAVLLVAASGSAQYGGLSQDTVDQAANSTISGEAANGDDEAPGSVARTVTSRLDVGTQTEVVVDGQEHTFEAVFVDENEESAVVRVDGDTESVEIGDVVEVSDTEFEISSLEREGPRAGTIGVRASVEEGEIEFGERAPIDRDTGASGTDGNPSESTAREEGGSAGEARDTPTARQPRDPDELDGNERISSVNRSLIDLATVVERQQDRIDSLEDRIEQLEAENTGEQGSSGTESAADDADNPDQEARANSGGGNEEEGLLSSITGLVN